MRRSRDLTTLCVALAFVGVATRASAYPLDGFAYTGIGRLEAQRLIQIGELPGAKRPSGELVPLALVEPRLLDRPELAIPPADATLTARIVKLLGPQADRYGIALLDLSDRERPRYAEWNGRQHQNPGSVGKLMVALAIFQALADIHPDDIAAREQILRSTMIRADDFSVSDHHTVPFWNADTRSISRRPIHPGDTASLWTYLDWMMSPSSNSAAGMLQKSLIAITHFGRRYPAPPDEERKFFDETPKPELGAIFRRAIEEPITRNGLDLDELRQGSFFTHQGKRLVPGTSSHATPRALVEFTLKLEQGRLVDAWSSREIKRLMYVTERRIRYGSAGVLQPAALYFKSGSLYSCAPEEGFVCRKYHGNRRNYMNSVAIVEAPAGQSRLFYSVAVLSNVLRKNSAEDHRDLARAIHGLLLADHPAKPLAAGERAPEASYGEGFIGYEQERRAMQLKLETQEALLALGYEIGEIDGVIGPNTRAAIRRFQSAVGEAPDAEASEALLSKLRAALESRGSSRPTSPPAP